MDCTRVNEELIAFQLAALDGATRAAVEAHLAGCSRCVSAFLALKRAMDAAEDAVAPSEMVRARIRRAAEKQLTVDRRPSTAAVEQPQPKEQRPTARAAVWVMAATAAAVLVAAPFAWRLSRTGATPATSAARGVVEEPQAPVEKTVDTARATPDSLAFL